MKVALDLVERVVLAVLGALEQAINVRVQAVLQHLRALDEDLQGLKLARMPLATTKERRQGHAVITYLTRKRIQNLGDRTSRAPNPFAVHDVVHLAGLLGAERFRIHGSCNYCTASSVTASASLSNPSVRTHKPPQN